MDFKQAANFINIKVKEVLVKAYYSIGKVKVYYAPLYKSYKIIYIELGLKYFNNIYLQLAIKAVNNTIRPNGLIFILLIFSAYLQIINKSLLILVFKRAQAIKNAIKKL